MASTTHAHPAHAARPQAAHPTRRAERRKGQGRRFDDHAASILKSHVGRLDVHRRSVMLFYLLFGLLAGFFIGVAGAKGVFAKPALVEHSQIDQRPGQPLSPLGATSLLPAEQVRHVGTQGVRYASIIQVTAIDAYVAASDASPAEANRNHAFFGSKSFLMALLGIIFMVTVALTATFWRYLNQAYQPRRRIEVDWASAKKSGSSPGNPKV